MLFLKECKTLYVIKFSLGWVIDLSYNYCQFVLKRNLDLSRECYLSNLYVNAAGYIRFIIFFLKSQAGPGLRYNISTQIIPPLERFLNDHIPKKPYKIPRSLQQMIF